jgi:CBS domain-containing protein
MSLRGFINRPAPSLTPEAPVVEAVRLMGREKVGAVLVELERKLVGIFTYRDLIDRVLIERRDPATTRIREVMTSPAESIGKEAAYGEALRVMIEKDYTYLPVVDAEHRLLGMLSRRALLEHRVEELSDNLDSLARYFAADAAGGD